MDNHINLLTFFRACPIDCGSLLLAGHCCKIVGMARHTTYMHSLYFLLVGKIALMANNWML